jgi:hypothetical protein
MEKNPSEANSPLDGQEINCLLWNLKINQPSVFTKARFWAKRIQSMSSYRVVKQQYVALKVVIPRSVGWLVGWLVSQSVG